MNNPLPLRLPEPGPLLDYLGWYYGVDREEARVLHEKIRVALSSESGRAILQLLEIALEKRPVSVLDDPRALAARNAQCFIASDLRRIMSDETERLLEKADRMAESRRPGGRRRGRSDT